MSLDGLRAWIGVVERKLTMRTRVFLVLVAIAIGGAGTAIYLALDARDSAVSESDLQSVRDDLAGGTVGGESVASLEAQIEALQAEVAELQGGSGATATPGTGPQEEGVTDVPGATGPAGAGGASGAAGAGAATDPKVQEQLEALREKVEKAAEAGQ